jgi:hypothetical protein
LRPCEFEKGKTVPLIFDQSSPIALLLTKIELWPSKLRAEGQKINGNWFQYGGPMGKKALYIDMFYEYVFKGQLFLQWPLLSKKNN